MKELIVEIMMVVIPGIFIPLLTLLGGVFIRWLVSKIKKGSDESLVQDLEEILKNSVTSVYQTYVETLKQNKTFDKQAQMIAYTKARDLIVDSIKPKMKQYLKKHYGDFNTWLQTSIETTVNQVKQQGVK